MLSYALQRVLALLPTVAVPLVLVFLLLRLAPGDPAAILLGDQATEEQVAQLRTELGLDQPLVIQFLQFVGNILTLNLGDSLFLNKPVVAVIPQYAAVTLEIGALSLVFALVFGVALGTSASLRRRTVRGRTATGLGIVGISVPQFLFAMLLILIFAVGAHWFNVGGYVPWSAGAWPHIRSIILPALALGLGETAFVSRITRGAVLDVMQEPFVITAKSLGIPLRRINRVHILRMSSLQILTVAGLLSASVISGSAVIESIFGLPGMGRLLLDAVQRRDYQLVQGIVLFTGLVIIVVNLIVDLLYAVVDPRVQLARKVR
jgi:peptide/nickel transport system permease protein